MAPAGPEIAAELTGQDYASSSTGVIAIENVTVIPMDRERRLAGHTVLIEDGRITVLARQGRVAMPEDATLIDRTGRYLIPGRAEMHAHIPSSSVSGVAMERVLFLYAA